MELILDRNVENRHRIEADTPDDVAEQPHRRRYHPPLLCSSFTHDGSQKLTFSPICTSLDLVEVEMMRPKAGEPSELIGFAKFVWLKILKISAMSFTSTRSLILKAFCAAKSKLMIAGPRKK